MGLFVCTGSEFLGLSQRFSVGSPLSTEETLSAYLPKRLISSSNTAWSSFFFIDYETFLTSRCTDSSAIQYSPILWVFFMMAQWSSRLRCYVESLQRLSSLIDRRIEPISARKSKNSSLCTMLTQNSFVMPMIVELSSAVLIFLLLSRQSVSFAAVSFAPSSFLILSVFSLTVVLS